MVLYRALFATTYYGMFRVGEVTSGSHPILAKDVHIGINKNKMLFMLRSSKTHHKGNHPQTIKIAGLKVMQNEDRTADPFELLREFIVIRPKCKAVEEPFFIFQDRTAVKPDNMRAVLKTILNRAYFDTEAYQVHGFRIG